MDLLPSVTAAIDRNTAALVAINKSLQSLVSIGAQMSEPVKALVDEVAAIKTVHASVLALITKFSEQIAASADDPAAVLQAVQDLKDSAQPVADAVVANTPAVP